MLENTVKKLNDLLSKYQSMPHISVVRDSLEDEMSLLISNCMDTHDGLKEISRLMDSIDLSEWESIK